MVRLVSAASTVASTTLQAITKAVAAVRTSSPSPSFERDLDAVFVPIFPPTKRGARLKAVYLEFRALYVELMPASPSSVSSESTRSAAAQARWWPFR